MIHELLNHGKENARTGRELAEVLNCNIRIVVALVAKERRSGYPICATSGDTPGYYLAQDEKELEAYCHTLKNRANELLETWEALTYLL